MNWGILLSVLAYELVVVVGLGLYLSRKEKAAPEERSFLLSNRDLPVAVVAVTFALIVLGTPHIFGIFEMTWFIGAASIWFGIAHAILLVATILSTAIWARRARVTSMPEFISQIFGETPRLMVSFVMAGLIWGSLTLESQGIGIVFAAVTGITIPQGAMIGGFIGILYVIFAGMKEIGWVNLINCGVMYVGLMVTMVFLTGALPEGGWGRVSSFYIDQDQAEMLSLFGTPELLYTFALGTILSVTFCQSISQQHLQPAMSAKSEVTIRRTLWIAVPLNGLFAVFIASIGLAAKADPAFNELGPKLAAPTMLLNSLPEWLVAWLMASLLAAVLSSFAMAVLAPATIFTSDVYKNLFNPQASEAEERRVTRIMIVVLGVAAFLVAGYLPTIVEAINWLFAWMTPVFWMIIIGLFWKRSSAAATITMAVTWIVNSLWSFTSLPTSLGLESTPNVYPCLVVSLVVGPGLTAVFGGKTGLFRERKSAGAPAGASK
ncbi:sodium:solute symporter family protein [Halomonas sp. LR5S13]|uniref:sodium:solute symporter family protein n=1 Tax=Halomonas rhizosphaerae TaxID=3043296 RepID=UPI0024A97CA4|nr:sodium:solute symporter family protein [Halomonas rhizosphaerae]MDI5922668.1 sodium:solute symporter family protein [Halomonas rhizosphaerae]